MQLTIDTQKDSREEIRKAIRMLMSLVGDKEVYTNEAPKTPGIFSEDNAPANDAFANMFGSSDTKDDEYSELNVPKEEEDEKPQKVELY